MEAAVVVVVVLFHIAMKTFNANEQMERRREPTVGHTGERKGKNEARITGFSRTKRLFGFFKMSVEANKLLSDICCSKHTQKHTHIWTDAEETHNVLTTEATITSNDDTC